MAMEFGAELRGRLFAALTGSAGADVSGAGADVRGQLLAIGGSSDRTRSGINLTRAAARLGVSRRTCERWVQTAETGQGQQPSPQHARTLTRRARQAATTRAGRRAALQRIRQAPGLSRDVRVAVKGNQGPLEEKYGRDRLVATPLSRPEFDAMLDAYEQGGDRALVGWITDAYGADESRESFYASDWQFFSIDSIEVQTPSGNGWRPWT